MNIKTKGFTMALINCHECGKQVSSTAASCPNCGAPTASKETTTIQMTSKKLKLQYVMARTLTVIGIIWSVLALIIVSPDTETSFLVFIPLIITLLSGICAIVVKIKIWWHHG